MMRILGQVPLIRVVLPFIAGIFLSLNYFIDNSVLIVTSIISLLFIASSQKESVKINIRKFLFSIGLNFFLIASGCIISNINNPFFDAKYAGVAISGGNQIIKGNIYDQPKVGENTTRYTVEISSIMSDDVMKSYSGKAYLYIKNENTISFDYGDEIIFSSALKEIKAPANPGEFDFKKHSFYKGITLQGYADKNIILLSKGKSGNVFKITAYHIQQKLRKILDLHLDGQALQIANALLLGYDDEIGRELMQAYSVTGVLHVLSVSGMHVALVYAVLNFMLGLLFKNKKWKYIRLFISIGFIWFYAFITGLSPSVQRAALMLSFIILSENINRTSNIYNTMLASVLILLCINPFLLFDIGFQFSYLSVFGIVFVHSRLYQQYTPNWHWADKLWEMISVCISAQLITFPLSIYYFHKFPVYFLPSNLIIVPLTTIIMYACILLLIISPLKVVAYYIAMFCSWLIECLNDAVIYIKNLPYASLNNIYWNEISTLLIYFCLFSVIIFLMNKYRKSLYLVMISIVVLLIVSIFYEMKMITQKRTVVYALKNDFIVDFIDGKKCIIISPIVPSIKSSQIVANYRSSLGIKNTTIIQEEEDLLLDNFCKINRAVSFNNKTFLIGNSDRLLNNPDYLIVNKHQNKSRFIKVNNKFIAGTKISKRQIFQYRKWYKEQLHSQYEKGAAIIEMK